MKNHHRKRRMSGRASSNSDGRACEARHRKGAKEGCPGWSLTKRLIISGPDFVGKHGATCHLEGEGARFQLLFVMLSTVHF